MIDFHTHILPFIDDGSKNIEESISMLKELSALGAERVLLSPHYYPDKERIETFSARRSKSCEQLALALKKESFSVPKLHVGAEVYLEPILLNNEDLSPLTIDMGGKFMVTELLYEPTVSATTESILRQLIYSYDIVPIIAHIDRYPHLMKEKNLYSLLEMGCVAQINVSSMENYFKRKKLLKYFKKGYIGVIGSDIHRPNQIDVLKKSLSYIPKESLNYMSEISKGILKNTKKDSDDSNEIVVD